MSRVYSGLEVFLGEFLEEYRGMRMGVILHAASVNAALVPLVEILLERGAQLRLIMGPQHGLSGETQDNMIEWEGHRDPRTGIPILSLYGKNRKPPLQALQEVDVILLDLQDVGARYYTFASTMALAMEACREADLPFLVLDRPNPINGIDLEGPVLDPAFRSFVGLYPLPVRHGMTLGELARFYNEVGEVGCRLRVIPMRGWRRSFFFDQTGLPWVMPSPNIPTLDSALVYPGLCLLEGTNVSEGRGTTRPFEISGAPWVDPWELVERLRAWALPGVHFRPLHFIPTFHKWQGEKIGGVQIHVLDRSRFRPFFTGLALVRAYRELGGEAFQWKPPPYEYEYEKLPFDILCGTDRVRKMLEGGAELGEMEASWREELENFSRERAPFLLYPE